ncbi:probable mediator of RNA polymerase II transcription subunit 26a [Eucalyptus grandis]|uniref:probable mediator of RNA polymerase II transcription subunit 26a n=1 Tax=Eucalyptus grandis TaxID=71139 RepID=UPI00192EC3B8|nr:probable mediator of RNA polymerase II transcription subunit 26a [Eucalyptus grandis]
MGESLDVWRVFFRTTDTDIFEFIDKAITIAALDFPKDFLSRRGRIAERLFSREAARAGGDCAATSKESKANGHVGNAAHDVVSINCSHGEAETFSDDIEWTSQVVREVLRIKRVLDNSRRESDSALHESLRRLQSMSITVDILEKTKIGVSVNNLRRNCGSKQIALLAHNITMGWKALVEKFCCRTGDAADPHKVEDGTTSSVKNQNIGEPPQEKYDFKEPASLAKKKRKLNVNQQPGTGKPNMSSNTNSRTTPASEVASWKLAKERMFRSKTSNRSITGCKRQNAIDVTKGWNEVVADIKYEATKRKMQELYQKVETGKRRRTVQTLDLCDLPEMAANHKPPCARTAKAHRQRVISRSRVSCV